MGQFVSLHWTLSNVFGFSDHDIEEIIAQQEEDGVRIAVNQAKAEEAAQKNTAETPPPPPEQPEDPNAPEAPPPDGVQPAPPEQQGAPAQSPAPAQTPAAQKPPPVAKPQPPNGTDPRVQKLINYRNKKYPLTQSR